MAALYGREWEPAERLDRAPGRFATVVPGALLLLLAASLQAGEAGAGPTVVVSETFASDESQTGGCVESSTVMCLQDRRYEATLEWTKSDGEVGSAKVARPRTRDSGLFFFFSYNNWEVLLKVLDGCTVNEHHWVYAASATDLGLKLVVRDTVSGQERIWTKDPGSPARAITASGAFPGVCEGIAP